MTKRRNSQRIPPQPGHLNSQAQGRQSNKANTPKDEPADKENQSPSLLQLSPQNEPTAEAHNRRKEKTTCRPDQTPLWKIVVESGAFFAALCVAVIYYGQLRQMINSNQEATRAANAAVDTYENTVRPYIGVAMHATIDRDPRPVVNFNAIFKNYGTIPAQNFVTKWRVFLNGKELPVTTDEHATPTFLPQGEISLMAGQIGYEDAPSVINGSKSLQVYTSYSYTWRNKNQSGCEGYYYWPKEKGGGFLSLGRKCAP